MARYLINVISRLITYVLFLPYYYVHLFYTKYILEYQPVLYRACPLSEKTANILKKVNKKIMVLDLDETLIHSQHTSRIHYDFMINVVIDSQPAQFYVYKRPHLDFFLKMVSQWYEVVIFTASIEAYGNAVANCLDPQRKYFCRRYYRHNCTADFTGYTKDIRIIEKDLSRIFIIDNSPAAYKNTPDNAIPIKSWFSDPSDKCLLNLLPFLDALRFASDVKSILKRNIHHHSLW